MKNLTLALLLVLTILALDAASQSSAILGGSVPKMSAALVNPPYADQTPGLAGGDQSGITITPRGRGESEIPKDLSEERYESPSHLIVES